MPSPSADRDGSNQLTGHARTGVIAFGVIALLAGGLCLYVTRSAVPTADEWLWFLYRRGNSAHAFLTPYNGHFSLVPLLIYRALWTTVGLRTYVPYRLVVIALHVLCATLVFAYARRRLGDLLAVAAGTLILFFGAGWQDFLWPFQTAWLLSVVGGLGALLALDRGDRRGELMALAALCLALASSGVGAAVAVGVAIDVLIDERRRRRAWVVLVPVALYGLWWIAYEHTDVAPGARERTPAFVLHLLEASLSGLLGVWRVSPDRASGPVGWRVVLLAAALVLLAWRAWRRRVPARVWALGGALIFFAVGAGLNRSVVSAGEDSRYLYPAAVLIVLMAVELGAAALGRGAGATRPAGTGRRAEAAGRAGREPGTAVALGLAVVAGIVAVANVGLIRDAGGSLRSLSTQVRADIAALGLGSRWLHRGYTASHFPYYPYVVLDGQELLHTARDLRFSIPGLAQLTRFPPAARAVADGELIALEGLSSRPSRATNSAQTPPQVLGASGGQVSLARGCLSFAGHLGTHHLAAGASGLIVALPGRGVSVSAPGGVAVIAVRRFAPVFQVVGLVLPGRARQLAGAPDRAPTPWQVRVAPSATARVCALR